MSEHSELGALASNESNGPNDRYRKVENHPWELLPCRLCGFSAELWQRWVMDDIWCSFGACSNLEDVDGEACIFHLPDSGHFYCERKSEAVRYWNLMMGPRGSNETLQPHQDLALARINHLARKGRFDEADAQLFRDAIVHRPGSVPHHHIWSVNGPPRDPDPEQVCDFGCGLKWKDRQEAEAHAQKAGEPQCSGLCSGLPDANCPVHGLKATLSEGDQR